MKVITDLDSQGRIKARERNDLEYKETFGLGSKAKYARTHEEIMARYGDCMKMQEEMPPMNWPQMGRYMYTARLETFEEAQAFIAFVQGA